MRAGARVGAVRRAAFGAVLTLLVPVMPAFGPRTAQAQTPPPGTAPAPTDSAAPAAPDAPVAPSVVPIPPGAPLSTLIQPDDPRTSLESEARAYPSAYDPGYFNELGTAYRAWEIRSDSAFSTSRVYAQRFEIGHVFHLNRQFGIAARVDFGADADTNTGLYAIDRPIVSAGIWARSRDANYVVEFGLRAIPDSSGPNDDDPRALALSLDATLAAGIADDASWLSFADWGVQIYGKIQTRTDAWRWCGLGTFALGATYGGESSLAPLSVRSWLGPQKGIVGNVFLDVFLLAPRLGHSAANVEVGAHTELSLSGVWAGDQPFPVMLAGYLGWSPKYWVSARAFFGIAQTLIGMAASHPYGASLVFYVP